MNNKQRINKLCEAVVKEAILRGYADLRDTSYNKDATVTIDLRFDELRCAADLVKYKPTKQHMRISRQARAWEKYLNQLDSVE